MPMTGKDAKKALVVGVAYTGNNMIKNTENDAEDVAAQLREMGFKVSLQKGQIRLSELMQAVIDFQDSIKEGDIALFFFAGHGWQYHGRNWLLVTVVPKDERMLESTALDADVVLRGMQNKGARFQVLVLDCCRSLPEMRRADRSTKEGLMALQAPQGSMVAYACAPGQTAADGDGRNGVYTKHLLKHLANPELELQALFAHVGAGVEEETNGKQIPWETMSIRVVHPSLW